MTFDIVMFEPRDFGLQEKVDFLRDRASSMDFKMELPPLDFYDL
jgi:hypothetical protein